MQIVVATLNGRAIPVEIQPSDSIAQFASKIEDQSGIPADMQRLIFQGRELEADKQVSDYGITANTTVNLILRMRGSSSGISSAFGQAAAAPAVNHNLEKCWSAAYSEEWDKAKEYLDNGSVSLDALEGRTGRPLWKFFAERGMIAAIKYLLEHRGKPSNDALLAAINQAVRLRKDPMTLFLLNEVTNIKELESVAGAAQPLHVAMVHCHTAMVKELLSRGADPNFFATTGCEGVDKSPGTPLMALALAGGSHHHEAQECVTAFMGHPTVDVNYQHPETGDTALHLLVKQSWPDGDTAVMFIKNGMDPNIVNADGKRAVDCIRKDAHSKEISPIERVFKLVEKGKLKPKKRAAAAAGEGEPAAKAIKQEESDPIFHTLEAPISRLDEWAIELKDSEEDDDTGEMRDDQGEKPLRDAIRQDLADLAGGTAPIANAAKIAQEIADKLGGWKYCSETDCKWIPFVVAASKEKRKASVMVNIRQAIRAPKAKLSQKKITKVGNLGDALQADDHEIENEDGADTDRRGKASVQEVFAVYQNHAVKDITYVRFPEEAICYPVFIAGTVDVDAETYAVVGVYAIRVDT